MTQPAFDILCPTCGAVVPHDASGCLNCAPGRKAEPAAAASLPAPPAPKAPDLGSMALKDYHRVVRSNYRAVEGAASPGGAGFVLRTYAPMVLLAVGLLVAAALALSGRL